MSSHPNPLIYLRGISTLDMMYILDFIYQGEVSVAHEELDKFLEVAETLKIKGLVQNKELRNKKRSTSPILSKEIIPKKPKMLMDPCSIKVEDHLSDPIPEEPTHGVMVYQGRRPSLL